VTRLKCDRERPCEACQQRGLSESCTYATSNTSNKSTRRQGVSSRPLSKVQGHIVQSEHLAVSLPKSDSAESSSMIQGSEQIALPGTPHYETSHYEVDKLRIENSLLLPIRSCSINLKCTETTYIGSSHWTALLDRVTITFHI
jgi:hypothetical protein